MAKTLKQLQPHKFSAGDTVKVVRSGTTEWCKIGDTHTIRICKHDHEDGPVYVVDDDNDGAWIRECNLELVERDREKGGEWKRHRGGKQPVADGTHCEYRYRDGTRLQGWNPELSNWSHYSCDTDIMSYRVISQPQAEEVEVQPDADGYRGPFPTAPIGEPENIIEYDIEFKSGVCSVEAKTEYFDGPLKWRDTVNELDAYIEEFTRERDALIERLASEGFALIPPVVSVVSEFSGVDMSDWRNWKAGDVLESMEQSMDIKLGGQYILIEDPFNEGDITFRDDAGDIRGRHADKYKFIRRP